MMKNAVRGIVLMIVIAASVAEAVTPIQRKLTEQEQKVVLNALLAEPSMSTSDDPSCKTDLSKPDAVSIAQALGWVLARAADEAQPVLVKVNCFVRRGYPLGKGQEYCRVGLVPSRRPGDFGYGVAFIVDWPSRTIVRGSAECF
jgi:hypothetical protein